MTPRSQDLEAAIAARFADQLQKVDSTCNELTYEVAKDDLLSVSTALRDEAEFAFEILPATIQEYAQSEGCVCQSRRASVWREAARLRDQTRKTQSCSPTGRRRAIAGSGCLPRRLWR